MWCVTVARTDLCGIRVMPEIFLPLFGIVLALGSVWTLIPVAVASIIAVIRTVLEDRTLQEELPGYRDYAQRVRYQVDSLVILKNQSD